MKQFSIRSFIAWFLIFGFIFPFGIAVKVILRNNLIWGIILFIPYVLVSVFLILVGLNLFPSQTKNKIELLTGLICAIALSLISIVVYHRVDPDGVVNSVTAPPPLRD
jgi:uncharacterized membrane protein